jgi:hypothetical protein
MRRMRRPPRRAHRLRHVTYLAVWPAVDAVAAANLLERGKTDAEALGDLLLREPEVRLQLLEVNRALHRHRCRACALLLSGSRRDVRSARGRGPRTAKRSNQTQYFQEKYHLKDYQRPRKTRVLGISGLKPQILRAQLDIFGHVA